MEFLQHWASLLWEFMVAAGGPLLFGFAIAGIIGAYVPRSWISKQLGSGGIGSVFKASLIGIPMPLCSCSVIPTAAALRRGGASRGASASFAISTPEIDAPAISLTWGMLGPVMAIARPIASLASAVTAGMLIDLLKDRAPPDKAPEPCCESKKTASCCQSSGPKPEPRRHDEPEAESCCASKAETKCGCAHQDDPKPEGKLLTAIRYGFLDMPRDLAFWLVLGLVLSALIAAALPADALESWIGSGLAAKGLMLLIGIPFYVCATASTPLAAALIAQGLSPGAALVFLLAGPATNPATMGWVFKDLGGRALVIYLLVISGFAFGSGVMLDALIDAGSVAPVEAVHEHGHGPVATGAGVILAALLLIGLVRRCVPAFKTGAESRTPQPG